MRIAPAVCIMTCVLLAAGPFVVVGQPKYGVTVKAAKATELAKAKTYVWSVTQPSLDKTVDAMIVAAVDRELAARGLAKLPSGRSDVVVTYASLRRTDSDLSKASKSGESRQYAVGTLVVDLTDPTNRQLLFGVRMDTPIGEDRATLERTIDEAVAAMFTKYPRPSKR